MISIVDTGQAKNPSPNNNIEIPTVPVFGTPSVFGALLLLETGVSVAPPSSSIGSYNLLNISATIGVKAQTAINSELVVMITQTDVSIPDSSEDIIYTGYETILENTTGTTLPLEKIISINIFQGGHSQNITPGYYRYRLYIVRTGNVPDPGTQPVVKGPIELVINSYVRGIQPNIIIVDNNIGSAISINLIPISYFNPSNVINMENLMSIPGNIVTNLENDIVFIDPGVYTLYFFATVINNGPNSATIGLNNMVVTGDIDMAPGQSNYGIVTSGTQIHISFYSLLNVITANSALQLLITNDSSPPVTYIPNGQILITRIK